MGYRHKQTNKQDLGQESKRNVCNKDRSWKSLVFNRMTESRLKDMEKSLGIEILRKKTSEHETAQDSEHDRRETRRGYCQRSHKREEFQVGGSEQRCQMLQIHHGKKWEALSHDL